MGGMYRGSCGEECCTLCICFGMFHGKIPLFDRRPSCNIGHILYAHMVLFPYMTGQLLGTAMDT